MKRLFVLIALLIQVNAEAATCGKVKHRSYPQDEQAKVIADELNVKTCDGKRFQETVAALGFEVTYVAASEETRAALDAGKEAKRAAEQEKIKQALGL